MNDVLYMSHKYEGDSMDVIQTTIEHILKPYIFDA